MIGEETLEIMPKEDLHITMLGTGNAGVTKCYNTCFTLSENNEYFLIDAGGGNQILRILEQQGIPLTEIHNMFITHAHSDHILGAVWIIRMIGQMMNKGKYEGSLKIYASEKVLTGLQNICRVVLAAKVTGYFGNRIELIAVNDGETHSILGRKVTFFDIMSTKIEQYGFEIKEDGLLFCGDEPLKDELLDKACDCNYLIHEAFCMYAEREKFKPYEKHHSTVKDACIMAEKMRVRNLILVHTEDTHIPYRKKLYTEEGKEFFSGNLIIPDDGEILKIL